MNTQIQHENRQVKACLLVTLISLLVTGGYAYLRYVHFGPILVDRIPLYVSNKMISWSSVVLLGLSLGIGPMTIITGRFQSWIDYRKGFGLIGIWLATLHIAISLPIFNMFYYTSFFNFDGTLTMTSELSMLAGGVAWSLLLIPLAGSIPSIKQTLSTTTWQRLQNISFYALIIVFGHVAWLGWNGWFQPDSWFGGMPPITLLSCLIILLLVVLKLFATIFNRGTQVG